MTGLKKLFNVAVLLYMVCWCLALLVPEQPTCVHAGGSGVPIERHPVDAQIACSQR
jgi:hypothetical protein